MQFGRLTIALFLLSVVAGTSFSALKVRHKTSPGVTLSVRDLSPKFLAFCEQAVKEKASGDARWELWKKMYHFAAVPPTPEGDKMARDLLDRAWDGYPSVLEQIRLGARAAAARRLYEPETPCGYRNRRVRRTAIEPQRQRGGEVLPQSKAAVSQRASGNGGHWACPLVRTAHGRTGFRVMDRRPSGDQGRASPQAEDGSRGCSTSAEADVGKPLSANMGSQSGESGSASATVASTSAGADANSSHEPVTGHRYG